MEISVVEIGPFRAPLIRASKNGWKGLKKLGIGCSLHFIPIHKHEFYKKKFGYKDADYEVANKVFDESLSLPIYVDMTESEVKYVIANVLETMDYLKNNIKNTAPDQCLFFVFKWGAQTGGPDLPSLESGGGENWGPETGI